MSLELETLLYIEVGVKYKNALQKKLKGILFIYFYCAGFFYKTKSVNNLKNSYIIFISLKSILNE